MYIVLYGSEGSTSSFFGIKLSTVWCRTDALISRTLCCVLSTRALETLIYAYCIATVRYAL